jgi:predicted TIM-barrel fold metal-dependent hydrolase
VVCESGWTFQARIVEFAKELPRHKIVFGTDSPPNEPGMWLRELEVLCGPPPHGMNLDEDGLEDYMGNNIARLCGIKTTPPPKTMAEAEARLKDTYAGVQ